MAVVRLVIAGQRMQRLLGGLRLAAGGANCPTPLINKNAVGMSVSSTSTMSPQVFIYIDL